MRCCILLLSILILPCLAFAQQNVGIGTTTPHATSILELNSTNQGFLFPRMTFAQRTAIPGPATGLIVYQTDLGGVTNPSGVYFFDGTFWKRIARADEISGGGGGSTGWTVLGDNQYSNLTGNVGIGTSNPTSKFHLVGNMLTENGSVTINNPTAILQLQTGGINTGFIQLSGQNLRLGTNSGNTQGKVIFRMNGMEHVVIDTLGQMGIGTTVPKSKLHVDEGSFASYSENGHLMLGGAFETNLVLSRTEILARNSGNPSTLSLQQEGGVVRIGGTGVTADNTKLHVTDGSFANLTTQNGHILLGETTSTNLVLGAYEILARDNGQAAPLYLQQEGGTVRLGSGSVATGTKLQITDGVSAGLNSHGFLLIGHTAQDNLVMDTDNIQARDNGATSRLKLNELGGIVQIGSNADPVLPATKLYIPSGNEVNYSDDGLIHLGREDGTNMVMDENEILVRNNGNASTLYLQNDGGAMRVGTNKLFVDSDGEVGIGTTNPLSKLDVAGRIRVVQSNEAIGMDGSDPYLGLWYNGAYRSKIQQLTDQLYIHSIDKVHLDGDQIAIGDMLSSADGYKLTVTGKVICEELRVELAANWNWPDYVFHESYALRSLPELKAFIQEHHHLPNIPKADEVESSGFEVGEMNRKLLEKVEELTLYILDLQDQINTLKASISQPNHE